MKIFKKRYLAVALLVTQMSNAQDGGLPIYSDYLSDNYYLLHPAMAGLKNSTQVRGAIRQQWGDVDDAPQTQTLTVNTRIGERSGIGIIAFSDKNGYHAETGAKLTYAHHITFSESRYELNMLSFGMSAGFSRITLDETKFGSVYDPILSGGLEVKDSYFTVDFGAAYHRENFFSMFTVKNAVTSKRELYSDVESDNSRRYLLGAGYTFGDAKFNGGWMYEPSVLVQYVEETELKLVDINMKVYKTFEDAKLWAGVSYRRDFDNAEYVKGGSTKKQALQSLSPLLGGSYKNFSLTYTYTHELGDRTFNKSGFHLFTLGVNIFSKRSSLDCNCPNLHD
ncbi:MULTISPECIES: type IX secretion system membrane protein PorP/SprF [unclassified Myroides]|uniref:PorP/SprF family type IX secretion system membrane protein n=1 Tax=unclassified Myroides TaxID=2642485 RepID=UPI0015FCEA4A|nr:MULTISPECIES: type IX secretion system membrane protein PorP/SprF [unclassified Myroides]MBB1148772.1 type IX secretion system membrane protein PorP/SprF [Myroides sp. NP-2]MDM1406482.1 type IX secretion system membrane protein PorP/SprF [Myroides sp. DF42-4-2]